MNDSRWVCETLQINKSTIEKKKQAEVQVCASIGASVEREVELSLDGAEV